MGLDRFTIRNLELVHPMNDGGTSLQMVIDRTISPMGSRLMKRWLMLPLKSVKAITQRHEAVEYFIAEKANADFIRHQVEQIGDVERMISKVSVGRINPREVLQLGRALKATLPIKERLDKSKNSSLTQLAEQLNPCASMVERISKELNPEAPVQLNKGGVSASGINEEIDDLREIKCNGK